MWYETNYNTNELEWGIRAMPNNRVIEKNNRREWEYILLADGIHMSVRGIAKHLACNPNILQ